MNEYEVYDCLSETVCFAGTQVECINWKESKGENMGYIVREKPIQEDKKTVQKEPQNTVERKPKEGFLF
jgi:hypothetical protein